MKPRVLVAGIGNIFFADDGFGPAVLTRLMREPIVGVRFEDFGIRGLHLAYELTSGYAAAVIVDAVARGGPPGTLFVIEPSEPIVAAEPDAHRMDLGSVFGFLRVLESPAPPVTIVGCEPETLAEGGEISTTVSLAVEAALPVVRRLIDELLERTENQLCTEV